MRFPTHWVSEKHEAHDRAGNLVTRQARGWSSISDDDARRVARERAKRAVDYAIDGTTQALEEYGYGVDPAREELIDTLEVPGQAEPIAVVTRNRYGVLVLNTQNLLIADIDTPKPTGGRFSRLFGKKPPPAQETMMQTLRDWHSTRSGHNLRVYRTAAGFRVLFVESPHEATAPATVEVLKSLNSDPLYIRLCERQRCFRARLTPKPWRCGADKPGVVFPYASEQHEQEQRAWEDRYIAASKSFATCRLLGTIGGTSIHPDVAPVVDLHDRYTLSDGRPLA